MTPARLTIAVVLAAMLLPACGDEPGPDAARFCEINDELATMDPYSGDIPTRIATGIDMQGLLEELVEVAPAEIEPDAAATLDAFARLMEVASAGLTGGIDGVFLFEATTDLENTYAAVEDWIAENCDGPG